MWNRIGANEKTVLSSIARAAAIMHHNNNAKGEADLTSKELEIAAATTQQAYAELPTLFPICEALILHGPLHPSFKEKCTCRWESLL